MRMGSKIMELKRYDKKALAFVVVCFCSVACLGMEEGAREAMVPQVMNNKKMSFQRHQEEFPTPEKQEEMLILLLGATQNSELEVLGELQKLLENKNPDFFLEKESILSVVSEIEKETLLSIAHGKRLKKIVEFLISKGANPYLGSTLKHTVSILREDQNVDMLKIILRYDAQYDAQDAHRPQGPLWQLVHSIKIEANWIAFPLDDNDYASCSDDNETFGVYVQALELLHDALYRGKAYKEGSLEEALATAAWSLS